jgi:hypothetical protein
LAGDVGVLGHRSTAVDRLGDDDLIVLGAQSGGVCRNRGSKAVRESNRHLAQARRVAEQHGGRLLRRDDGREGGHGWIGLEIDQPLVVGDQHSIGPERGQCAGCAVETAAEQDRRESRAQAIREPLPGSN